MRDGLIPLTRPITVVFHEPIVDSIREVVDEEYDGNMSDYIRQVVHLDLLKRRKITPNDLKDLR